jgi:hypothetical protein
MTGIGTNSNLGQNIQWILENQIRRDVVPVGDKNNVNLTYMLPGTERAAPGTLEVWLSCLKLQSDSFIVAADGHSFTIVLNPDDPLKLNCPPQQFEPLSVNYLSLDAY